MPISTQQENTINNSLDALADLVGRLDTIISNCMDAIRGPQPTNDIAVNSIPVCVEDKLSRLNGLLNNCLCGIEIVRSKLG
jgi:hypothetical protein